MAGELFWKAEEGFKFPAMGQASSSTGHRVGQTVLPSPAASNAPEEESLALFKVLSTYLPSRRGAFGSMLLLHSLDIATVLLLYMTSLIAGAGTLLLVWFRTDRPQNLALIGAAFIVQATGAFLAGLGEIRAIPAFVWRDSSPALGATAFSLLLFGVSALDFQTKRLKWLILLAPSLLILGYSSNLFADNTTRSVVFHAMASAANCACGVSILRGAKADLSPSRLPLALAFLLIGATYGLQIPLLAMALSSPHILALGFSVTLMMNFAVSGLLVSLVRERREQMYCHASLRDPLTNVFNRNGFSASVPTRIEPGAAIAVFDLDHFKSINDHFGHAAGDHTLIAFSRLIERHLVSGEIFARFGGEEFVVYFPIDRDNRIVSRVEAICASARALEVFWQDRKITVSVSCGLVIQRVGCVDDQEALLALADAALYEAKASGRSRVIQACQEKLAA